MQVAAADPDADNGRICFDPDRRHPGRIEAIRPASIAQASASAGFTFDPGVRPFRAKEPPSRVWAFDTMSTRNSASSLFGITTCELQATMRVTISSPPCHGPRCRRTSTASRDNREATAETGRIRETLRTHRTDHPGGDASRSDAGGSSGKQRSGSNWTWVRPWSYPESPGRR